MRALGPTMARPLGQPVVVDNRAGANGAVGTQAVARAAADGHTLILGNAETHAIDPLNNPKLSYNPVTEFTPVTVFARALRAHHAPEPGRRGEIGRAHV